MTFVDPSMELINIFMNQFELGFVPNVAMESPLSRVVWMDRDVQYIWLKTSSEPPLAYLVFARGLSIASLAELKAVDTRSGIIVRATGTAVVL